MALGTVTQASYALGELELGPGDDEEMTGSLGKGFKQRVMVRFVFQVECSRRWGLCSLPGSPSAMTYCLWWVSFECQEICSNQASLKSPSQLQYSVDHKHYQQLSHQPVPWDALQDYP